MSEHPPESEFQRWTTLDTWQQADELVQSCQVVVDRPAGSAHPKVTSFIYPVDYGYLDGTTGGDGEGIDVWRGELGNRVMAMAWTVDLSKRNSEVKWLLGCSPREVAAIDAFYATQPQAALLLFRPDGA